MTQQYFKPGTRNAAIFQTNAPYNNPYQGCAARWLFVCSAGLLRSPTGATLAAQYGINARSCGSNFNYALIPCSANLIEWADKIVFVNPHNLDELELEFVAHQDLVDTMNSKAIVLDIPDNYDYMDKELIAQFNSQLFDVYKPVTRRYS
jgi:protein-tyrosine phosphatase